jgi:Ca2+-transporting ATPase
MSNFPARPASVSSELTADSWHTKPAEEVANNLQTDLKTGLASADAFHRLEKYGSNRLQEEEKEPFWKEFIEELREPLILLLVLTGIIYIVLGEVADGITIFAVILLLNTIEVVNEQRAKKAISSLRRLAEPTALVIRDSRAEEIPVEEIVPGDIVLLQAGRKIPADARLSESYGLAVDESPLTGESVPVNKDTSPIEEPDKPLADRTNMVYSGTSVTRGRGKAIVIGTGMATETGRVTGMARAAREPRTPLQKAMDEVSKSLVWLALVFSIIIPVLGVLVARQPLQTMILTGLSLAFATIPEEMPIIITMVLAIGGFRLSRQNAIVKNLKAVETLGAITVIATDKTGTLTENRMQVKEIYPEENRRSILICGYLCNDTLIDGQPVMGDPLEIALIEAAKENGIDGKTLETNNPRQTEFSFDNLRQRMSVVTRDHGTYKVWTKGAPESILSISTQVADGTASTLDEKQKHAWLEKAAQMAESGLRVIALAQKDMLAAPAIQEEAESGLVFLGLVGMMDPPRQEVKDAIRVMQQAGIRSMMITGDHPLTARAIAGQVGMDGNKRVVAGSDLNGLSDEQLKKTVKENSIFARTTPEHKLRLVRALMAQDERVAVTGDGVNDAPALVTADIGVAMGETGSDIAREAGDIILADDNYTTISNAVREGRHLFANLKKCVRYYLAIKVALVGVMLLPVLLQIPVPFAPVQIILMELFMDLAAAAAFVAEPAEGDLMHIPPRDPKAPFMDKTMILSIFSSAAGLFAAVSAAYLLTWYRDAQPVMAQTVAFTTWMVGHVLLAFNMRSERQPLLQIGIFKNWTMIAWGIAAFAFVLLATWLPVLQTAVKTTPLRGAQWMLILGVAFAGTFWLEARKLFTYKH